MVNLKAFRKANGLKQEDLVDFFHSSKSFVSQIETGKTKFPDDRLTELLNNDRGWDTSMLIEEEPPRVQIQNSPNSNVATDQGSISINAGARESTSIDDTDMVPVIPTNIYKETDTNVIEYVNDPRNDIQMSPAVQQFPRTDLFYTVQTMAMYPHLHQGDILALKEVKRTTPIINGELYAVDSVDLGILVRFVYDRGDHIELRGSEDAKRFESFNISKDDIYNLFRVVGLVRTNI